MIPEGSRLSYGDRGAKIHYVTRQGLFASCKDGTILLYRSSLQSLLGLVLQCCQGALGGLLRPYLELCTNLIDDAVDAVSGGAGKGHVRVRTVRENGRVVVEVSDDGPGIPREAKGRIFEPFFTTKEIGEGTGLGLDIVRRIVSVLGGEIRVDSKPGETSFKVRLPVDGPRREQSDDVPNGG